MDWKRIGRLLVCLVLVVCLLVNISPIRANAALEWALLPVAAVVVTIAVAAGLGVSGTEGWLEDTASDTYTVMNRCINWLKENTDHIQIDPLTNEEKILCYATGNPDLPYMVQQSLVEDIRGFLFDSEILIEPYSYTDDEILPLSIYEKCASHSYAFVGHWTSSDGSAKVMAGYCDSSPFAYDYINNDLCLVTQSGASFQRYFNGWSTISTGIVVGSIAFSFFGTAVSDVSTDLDLSLGFVASSNVDFTTGYSDWSAGASSVPSSTAGTSDDVPVVPIGIGNTPEETAGISQSGQWSGLSTYVDTSTDTDTGTDTESGSGTGTGTGSGSTSVTVDMSGVITGLEDQTAQIGVWLGQVVAGIQSLPQAISDALTKLFVPSAEYVTARVDALRARFPFIDSIISTAEFIRDSVSGNSGPPKIYVDLALAPSGNYGSKKVLLTDFAWYAPYKERVDTVLSAALWMFFAWRVFLKLPGIISGESGVINEMHDKYVTHTIAVRENPLKKK